MNCDFSRKPGREADSVDRRQGRARNTYLGKYKERAVLLFSISGRCFCLHFREGLRADQDHWNRWSVLPFFPGISAGALCEKAGGCAKGYLHMLLHCLYLHLFGKIRRTDDYGTWPVILRWNRSFPEKKLPVLETGGDAKKSEKRFFIFWETGRIRRKDLPEAEGTGFSVSPGRTGGSLSF